MKRHCCLVLAVAMSVGLGMVGRVDTIGGTTYDWFADGPAQPWVLFDPGYGIHAVWRYSADTSGSHPDRNVRYNFYDESAHTWNWIDPDFMQSGVNLWGERVGAASCDVSPVTHVLYACGHAGTPPHPLAARDVTPGAGMFEYCSGAPEADSLAWPKISISSSGRMHAAACRPDDYELYYTGIASWCQWLEPFRVAPPLPDPDYPSYAIAASKVLPLVAVVWAAPDSARLRLYYRISTDDGENWLPPDSIPYPPAFTPGSDTAVSVGSSDVYPWYDPDDEEADGLQTVVAVHPVIQGQGRAAPVELWHWREAAGWTHIARVQCDSAHMAGGPGTGSLLAGRPSLARHSVTRDLICIWEQFDSSNIEPRTGLLRADVWAARGDSVGERWGRPVRLTSPDSTSKRFPSLAGRTSNDTFVVTYEADQCAGCAQFLEGPGTENPVLAHYVSMGDLPMYGSAVSEPAGLRRIELAAGPNPVRDEVTLRARLGSAADARVRVCDALGRTVALLEQGRLSAGIHTWRWKPAQTSAGVYFCALDAGGASVRTKVVVEK